MSPRTPTLYAIYGTIAAGKTTLARKLATQHGAVLLCEDEWLVRLEAEIKCFDDFRRHPRRLRAAIGPHVVELLRLGTPVVLDFAANTVNDRAWIRSLFEAANAAHELHVIEASEAVCRARLRRRNEAGGSLFRLRTGGDVRAGLAPDRAAVGGRGIQRHPSRPTSGVTALR